MKAKLESSRMRLFSYNHFYIVDSAEQSTPGSEGTNFQVGFMQNVLPRAAGNAVPDAYVLVTTNETGVVEFDVTTMFGGVQRTDTYIVDSSAPTRVNFVADDVYICDNYSGEG